MSNTARHPQCLWAQDASRVYITLDHPNLSVSSAAVRDGTHLVAEGSLGSVPYRTEMHLFAPVRGEVQVVAATQNCPCLVLAKHDPDAVHREPEPKTEPEPEPEPETEEVGDEDDLSELSSLSEGTESGCDEEEQVPVGPWWEGLLARGHKNRFVKPDWNRWREEPEPPAAAGGAFDMESLQAMLQQQGGGGIMGC